MATAHVPTPPDLEDELFDFGTQQDYSLKSQDHVNYHDRNGFAMQQDHLLRPQDHANYHGFPNSFHGDFVYPEQLASTSHDKLHSRGSETFIQRVPETPLLTQVGLRTPNTTQCQLNFSFDGADGREHIGLHSVGEIPEQYRGIFKNFSHFNFVQSKVFDDVMYTDNPLVTSAPTGSGKTVIFELAIVHLMMQSSSDITTGKIIYVAPIKALCSERFEDWQAKFGPLGLDCCLLTGDSQLDDYFELQKAQIIMTTPEKWDSMTRRWRDNKSLVQLVRLFLIDEVHQLNDETRGPTMEAIVSRMKTIQSSIQWEEEKGKGRRRKLRFIAISATMPNISDIASWLGTSEDSPALEFCIDESHRPVRLRRVVLGYPNANTEFKFDLSLNYRLGGVIQLYSDQKPTLVFCATRKGTQQAASTLVKDARFVMNMRHKQRLQQAANSIRDSKLRDLVVYGVGYHHAGMDVADRKTIETMFTAGDLPVLFATSTLAMGVNLPAHLVVIKSTMHYIAGMFQECSESQILQMIGRAGRPQFDTTATAVIMTRNSTKVKYEALLSGNQLIESNLHLNLIEHLNAEVVLHTITDVSIALEWLRSTFFYIRVKQNPKHYGMSVEHSEMEEELQQLCLKNLNMLESCSLIKMEDGFMLQHTDMGRLMARYCVAFESMKRLLEFKGKETLADLVSELSQCKEFKDVRLRVNEKKALNTLNRDKNRPTIRFPMTGKVKSTDMKVNCLIQATLGCLPIQEFGLNQDSQKIFRAASRLSKCLMEIQMLGGDFQSLLSAITLHKCIQAKLWENSKFVSRQLDKIGLTLSTTLVNAGLTSFEKLRSTSPREIELIMNRHPPFGNQIRDAVTLLPCYKLSLNQYSGVNGDYCELEVTVFLLNYTALKGGRQWGDCHTCLLLIGDADNKVLLKQKISDSQLMSGGKYSRKVSVQRARAGDKLRAHYISLDRVGVDNQEVFSPSYSNPPRNRPCSMEKPAVKSSVPSISSSHCGSDATSKGNLYKPCNHRCLNKAVCGHECCKNGIPVKTSSLSAKQIKSTPKKSTPKFTGASSMKPPAQSIKMTRYVDQLHANFPATPVFKRMTPSSIHNPSFGENKKTQSLQDRFSYNPQPSMKYQQSPFPAPSTGTSGPRKKNLDFTGNNLITSNECDPQSKTEQALIDFAKEGMDDYINHEDFFTSGDNFDDDDDESFDLPSVSSIYHSTTSSERFMNDIDGGGRKTSHQVVTGRNSTNLVPKDYLNSTENQKALEKHMHLPFRGKKRLMDEIFDLDSGDNDENTHTVSAKLPRFTGMPRDNFVRKSEEMAVFKTPMNSTKYSKRVSESRGHPFQAKTVKLSSTNNPTSSNSRSKDNLVAGEYLSDSRYLSMPKQAELVELKEAHDGGGVLLKTKATTGNIQAPVMKCASFFTAGNTEGPEDETEGDTFGSIFAGIF